MWQKSCVLCILFIVLILPLSYNISLLLTYVLLNLYALKSCLCVRIEKNKVSNLIYYTNERNNNNNAFISLKFHLLLFEITKQNIFLTYCYIRQTIYVMISDSISVWYSFKERQSLIPSHASLTNQVIHTALYSY